MVGVDPELGEGLLGFGFGVGRTADRLPQRVLAWREQAQRLRDRRVVDALIADQRAVFESGRVENGDVLRVVGRLLVGALDADGAITAGGAASGDATGALAAAAALPEPGRGALVSEATQAHARRAAVRAAKWAQLGEVAAVVDLHPAELVDLDLVVEASGDGSPGIGGGEPPAGGTQHGPGEALGAQVGRFDE